MIALGVGLGARGEDQLGHGRRRGTGRVAVRASGHRDVEPDAPLEYRLSEPPSTSGPTTTWWSVPAGLGPHRPHELPVVEGSIAVGRDDGLRGGGVHDVAQLLGPVVGQQRVDDGARPEDGDRGHDRLVHVGQLHRHDVAHADPVIAEVGGQLRPSRPRAGPRSAAGARRGPPPPTPGVCRSPLDHPVDEGDLVPPAGGFVALPALHRRDHVFHRTTPRAQGANGDAARRAMQHDLVDHCAGREAQEVVDGLAHVLGPQHRRTGDLRAHPPGHRGVDEAGADGAGPDPGRSQLPIERPGQRHHRGLGGRVGGRRRRRPDPSQRGQEHDQRLAVLGAGLT